MIEAATLLSRLASVLQTPRPDAAQQVAAPAQGADPTRAGNSAGAAGRPAPVDRADISPEARAAAAARGATPVADHEISTDEILGNNGTTQRSSEEELSAQVLSAQGPSDDGQSADKLSADKPADDALSANELSGEQQQDVTELQRRDQEVRTHEQAHQSAGGQYTGAASYSYTTGPDGQRYATGGSVPIDASPVSGDPAATIRKMRQVRAAALAPADPSGADRQVASTAARQMTSAQSESNSTNEAAGTDASASTSTSASTNASTSASASASNEATPVSVTHAPAGLYSTGAATGTRARPGAEPAPNVPQAATAQPQNAIAAQLTQPRLDVRA